MHELIRDFYADEPPSTALLRLGIDDGALVAAFGESPVPRWIAKTAHGEPGCQRLRYEAAALRRLEPWATALHLPSLLGWADDLSPAFDLSPRCCLVQTGVAGCPPRWRWHPTRAPHLPRHFGEVLDWLRRLQNCVPAPHPGDLQALLAQECERARTNVVENPRFAAVLLPLVQALPALHGGPRLVVVHGDLWPGNLLLATGGGPVRVGAIDWSGMDSGSAWFDLLTLFSQIPDYPAPSDNAMWERWRRRFLSPGVVRETLRQWQGTSRVNDASARGAFYHFLLRRARWELGLGLQTRSHAEVEQAWARWQPAVRSLQAASFPDPFSGSD